jgi:Flp pilus assembly protein TadG
MISLFLDSVRRARRCQSGATAVEFAIVCLPLLLLAIGTVEFGRALYVRNNLAYAADVAARKVLIGQVPAASSEEEALAKLDAAARDAFGSGERDLLQVSVSKETVDGLEFRILSIRYPFTMFIPGMNDGPIGLVVTRRIPTG